jgi:hypothetical protein
VKSNGEEIEESFKKVEFDLKKVKLGSKFRYVGCLVEILMIN